MAHRQLLQPAICPMELLLQEMLIFDKVVLELTAVSVAVQAPGGLLLHFYWILPNHGNS
jgi:hypothetical protein